MQHAKLQRSDVGLVIYSIFSEVMLRQQIPTLMLQEYLGFQGGESLRVEAGAATEGYALKTALAQIRSGRCDIALVLGLQKTSDFFNFERGSRDLGYWKGIANATDATWLQHNGKPIEIISADLLNKPDVAAGIARRWFDVEQVDAIADVPLTSVAFAIQNIGRDRKKVILINAAAADAITKKECSPYTIHWQDDSYALSVGTARAVLAAGGKSWFFFTPDYSFGHLMEAAATKTINENGGVVRGTAKFPLNNADYSSQLVTASSSKADIFAASTVGGDTINLVKQANEFRLLQGKQRMVVFQVFLPEVHSLGLEKAHGMYVTDGFYWDKDDSTRAWSKEFFKRHGKMPSKVQAYVYLSIRHYLTAIKESGSDASDIVTKKMKSMPAYNFDGKAYIRPNGRVMYDLTLYDVKSPAESKYPWDYYRPQSVIPANVAFGGADTDGCAGQ